MNTEYTAENIRILSPDQVSARWFWAKAGTLAAEYHRPESWIERGLRACEEAAVPHDYFIDRYLKKLPLERHAGVEEAMLNLLKKNRPGPDRTN